MPVLKFDELPQFPNLASAGFLVTDGSGTLAAGTLGGEVMGTPAASVTGNWSPSDYGFLAWTCDPLDAPGSTFVGAGFLYSTRIKVPKTVTIANLACEVAVAGTGATALANCWGGIYNSGGTLIGTTTNQASVWNTVGYKVAALTVIAGQSLTVTGGAGAYVWASFLVGTQSTTQMTFRGFGGVGATTNKNLAATTPYRAGYTGTAQTTLPTSFATSGFTSTNGYWAAVT